MPSSPATPVIVQPRGWTSNSSTPTTGRIACVRVRRGERAAEDVVAERVAEGGHDHPLVERQVRLRRRARCRP